ncbi:SAM domain and HD [Rhizophlyctis rosea]|nr:SAM domain and HD [Rhizophlyctis rosea]
MAPHLYDKVINDPVHGHITLDEVCVAVIDTPQFQRLRELKQLGSAYFVFPGGSHNRFEHSIGVCHLAGELVNHFRSNQPELNITDSDVKCVKLAGLCHDLGHGPFSHIFDNEFMPKARPDLKWHHEKASEDMLEYMVQDNADVRDRITDEELTFIKDLIHGKPRSDYPQAKKLYLFEIVANKRNSVDVDKFDYIQRDCHNIGLKPSVDTNRLMMMSHVIDDQICYNRKEADNLYELTATPQQKRVYTHKVGKAVEYMVTDLLLAADKHFGISASVDDMSKYIHITDCLLSEIARSTSPELAEARSILHRLKKRDLYRFADTLLLPNPRPSRKIKEEVITPRAIVGWQKDGEGIREEDVIVEWLTLNYAMGPSNPVDSVNFFKKWDLKQKFPVKQWEVSGLIPMTFEETHLRIFTRVDGKRKAIQQAFRRLIEDIKNRPDVMVELGVTVEVGKEWASSATDGENGGSYSDGDTPQRPSKRKRGDNGEASVPSTPVRNGGGGSLTTTTMTTATLATPPARPGVPGLTRSPSWPLEFSEGQTLPPNYAEISSPARKKSGSGAQQQQGGGGPKVREKLF